MDDMILYWVTYSAILKQICLSKPSHLNELKSMWICLGLHWYSQLPSAPLRYCSCKALRAACMAVLLLCSIITITKSKKYDELKVIQGGSGLASNLNPGLSLCLHDPLNCCTAVTLMCYLLISWRTRKMRSSQSALYKNIFILSCNKTLLCFKLNPIQGLFPHFQFLQNVQNSSLFCIFSVSTHTSLVKQWYSPCLQSLGT